MGDDHRQRKYSKGMEKEKKQAMNAIKSTLNNLILERGSFKSKDGKDMWSYFIHGYALGREVNIDFVASDQGGYDVLDLLFSLEKDVKVVMQDAVMTDDKGRDTHYTVYEAQVQDDDGNVYSYKIKPSRNSDKSYLDFFLTELAKRENGGDNKVA